MSTRYARGTPQAPTLPVVRSGSNPGTSVAQGGVHVGQSYFNRNGVTNQGTNPSVGLVTRSVQVNHGPISSSSQAIPTQSCAYCRQDHIPNPAYAVSTPGSQKVQSTCSEACQKALLTRMIASFNKPASAPSSSYAAGPSYPAVSSRAPTTSFTPSNFPYSNQQWTGGYASAPPSVNPSSSPIGVPSTGFSYGTPVGQAVPYGKAPTGPIPPQQATQGASFVAPSPAGWSQAPPHSFAQHTPPVQAGTKPIAYVNGQTNTAAFAGPRVPQRVSRVAAPLPRVSPPIPQFVDLTVDNAVTPTTNPSYIPMQQSYSAQPPAQPQAQRLLPNGQVLPANNFLPPQHQRSAVTPLTPHNQHQLALTNHAAPQGRPQQHDKRDRDRKHDKKDKGRRDKKRSEHGRDHKDRKHGRDHSHAAPSHGQDHLTVAPPPSLTSKHPVARQYEVWARKRASLPPFWQVTTVVLDTNVLLDDHHPDAAFTLHHLAPELKFIVPYVLVQELDNLKARAGGPRQPARVAISRLYDILVSGNQKEKWIRGQKTDERLPLAGTLQTTSGDDRILECTNYFHTYSPPGQRVALLTFDKNLQLKATLLGMVTGNTIKMMEFFKELANLRKERDILRALLKDAKGVDDVPDNPDLRLEDYVPGKEEEVDEFKLMKQAADKAAKEAKETEEREQQTSKEAKLKEAQRADVLARVPEGTKTNLYDTSDDSESEVERSKKDKKDKKDKKEKKEKNKKKRKRDDTDSSEDEDEPAKKKAKSEDRSKLTPEVVVLDD